MKKLKLQFTLKGMNAIAGAERILYKKSSRIDCCSKLLTDGYDYGSESLGDELIKLEIEERRRDNEYFQRDIISRHCIEDYANKIVSNKEVRDKLHGFFGGCFCVGYISSYVTSSLPDDLRAESVYANHWHIDTLLSENSVKLMVLPKPIEHTQGPLQFFSINATQQITQSGFYRGSQYPTEAAVDGPLAFLGDTSRVLFVRSHCCMHTAGVPAPSYSRNQIMIQLNPARKWSYHTDLYDRQYSKELTLPLVKNSFRGKKKCIS